MPALDVETRVALMERDITQITGFFERLDSTMEKLTDVSAAIKKLLAVHEVKLARNEESTGQVYRILDQHRSEAKDQDIKIFETIKQTKLDLKEDMNKLEERILDELGTIKENQVNFYSNTGKRVDNLEGWKWKFTGIAVLLGFAATQVFSFLSSYFSNVLANLHK